MPRPNRLEKIVDEESTAFFKADFIDEDGEEVIPASITYHLMSADMVMILYAQVVAIPAATIYIDLSGSDLRLFENEKSYGDRVLLVQAVYNSDKLANAPLNKAFRFKVRNIGMVAIGLNISVVDLIFTSDTPGGLIS